ncbi:hypothetical protein HHK36_028649 [Tetracentron sinense]|uniref:Uncharacterized protein n=1 Tax=Tetracentron sinense TaxID=13715 RepID=A0A834YDI4_TETSI|nr:hypothetical protein HHK36_028649 [Tetracentron sinense]
MASTCNRFINRTALSSLKSAIKSKVRTHSLDGSTASTSSRVPISRRSSSTSLLLRFSSLNRSPSELGCAQSLLPLHSAVAVARLTSCLSSNSRSCRSLSQAVLKHNYVEIHMMSFNIQDMQVAPVSWKLMPSADHLLLLFVSLFPDSQS